MLVNTQNILIAWGDCDPAGIVFYPRYFAWFDAATAALFAAAGLPIHQLFPEFRIAGMPMVDTRARFHEPLRFGDEARIESSIAEFRHSSFDVRHRLFRGDILAVEGFETRVWTVWDPENPERLRSKSIPEEVVARFSSGVE